MPRLVCRLVTREGEDPFPCVVVDPDGWLLRLTREPSGEGVAPVGLVEGVAVWAEQVDGQPAAQDVGAPTIVIEDESLVDEVGVRFGPEDHGAGLFDAREATGTGDATGAFSEEAERDQQRTAVLAWIAATLGPLPAWPDTTACTPLKRLIADAPLDALPALDAVGASAGQAARPIYAPVLRARGDDTATVVDGQPTVTTSLTNSDRPVVPRWPLVLAACFALAAAIAWWWPR